MLWTDANTWVTEEDLKSVDREADLVASAEKIPLAGSNGIIARGISEAALEIMIEALQSFQNYFAPQGVEWTHALALQNTGSGSAYGNTLRIALTQIVVNTPLFGAWSAVKEFAVQHCLRTLYESAMARKEPDRYGDKYARINERLATRIRPMLFTNGLPCVAKPLSCPGATGEAASGSWGLANLSSEAGGANASAQAIDVAITYTGPGWTDSANAESAGSERIRYAIPANRLLKVDITSLNPPTGTTPRQTNYVGTITPMQATGWFVYVGTRGGTMRRQNVEPIPIATKTYTFAADPVTNAGTALGLGQDPDVLFTIGRTMVRG